MKFRHALLLLAFLPLSPQAVANPWQAPPGSWAGQADWRDNWRDDWRTAYALAPWWWGGPAPSIALFEAALSPWGQWRRLRGVGQVWVPRVGPGWRPYSVGGFVSDPRLGWRWVSAEPFGWAVFHYGRWGFDQRIGWFWVPDRVFAPHWADLRFGTGWFGWAALPPPGWGTWGWNHPGWLFGPWGGHPHRISPHPGWRPAPRELDRWRAPPAPPRSVAAAPRPAPTIGGPAPDMVEVAEPPGRPGGDNGLLRGRAAGRPSPGTMDAGTARIATRPRDLQATRPVGGTAGGGVPVAVPAGLAGGAAPPVAVAPPVSMPPPRPVEAAPRTVERAAPSPASSERHSAPQGERSRGFTPERMAEKEP